MAHDWAADVRKYVLSANEAAIDGIVKHLGDAVRFEGRMVPSSPTNRSETASAIAA
jgi:hypothetical protein